MCFVVWSATRAEKKPDAWGGLLCCPRRLCEGFNPSLMFHVDQAMQMCETGLISIIVLKKNKINVIWMFLFLQLRHFSFFTVKVFSLLTISVNKGRFCKTKHLKDRGCVHTWLFLHPWWEMLLLQKLQEMLAVEIPCFVWLGTLNIKTTVFIVTGGMPLYLHKSISLQRKSLQEKGNKEKALLPWGSLCCHGYAAVIQHF